MKLLYLMGVIFLLTIVIFSWGTLVDDFEENYVDTNISEATYMNSSYKEDYNNQSSIEEEYADLEDDLNALGSDSSWFDKLGTGLNVMFKGFISLPGRILSSTADFASNSTIILTTIGIPIELIYIGVTLLTIGIIFLMIELIRRYPM